MFTCPYCEKGKVHKEFDMCQECHDSYNEEWEREIEYQRELGWPEFLASLSK
jgi:sarcosine oxidase delta subunit